MFASNMNNIKHFVEGILKFILVLTLTYSTVCISERGEPDEDTYVKYFKMPGAVPKTNDEYLCTAVALNSTSEEWVIMYDPLASANRAHHMLLYGCSTVSHKNLEAKIWDCGHHGVCPGSKIMFAWAKNAPGIHLPPDVGFRIGGDTDIKYLTLQIHYAKPLEEGIKDESGLKMTLTKKQQKYKAGIFLLGSGFVDIPPLTPKTHADSNCEVGSTESAAINIFGYRVHAHTLGSVITGYKYNPKSKELIEIVKGNPQWPQAFYPMESILKVEPYEILHVRCTYNSTTRNRHTYIGSTSNDEMCNLYLMYFTDREKGSESGSCWFEAFKTITDILPPSSDEPLPPNKKLEAMTVGKNSNLNKQIYYDKDHKGVESSKLPFSDMNSDSLINDLLRYELDSPYNYIDNLYGRFLNPKNYQEGRRWLRFQSPNSYYSYYDTVDQTHQDQNNKPSVYKKLIQMPGVTPLQDDAYMCTAIALNATKEEWVTLFKPLASANRAHHMLLFGCPDIRPEFMEKGAWNCGHHGVCDGGRIMYAWAKNAPATHLPENVGFKIAGSSGINYLALQIHYAKALSKEVTDNSGLEMLVTDKPQKYKAGIYLLAASSVDIPPYTEKTHADVNCDVGNTEPTDINIFAFRVHTHKLGTVVSGYKYNKEKNQIDEIAKGNPHWPQAFYPVDQVIRVKPEEILHARCTYNSSSLIKHTYIGGTSDDEMCNLYLMYYTDAVTGSESGVCGEETYRMLTASLPLSSDKPLPPNPALEEMTRGENVNKQKEVTYTNVFNEAKPIEVEKKTQSRKDPQPSGFNDYEYPNYDSYDYEPSSFSSPIANWRPKQAPDYFSTSGNMREGKYQLKPKPVELYNEYGSADSENVDRTQFIGKNSKSKAQKELSKETLVSSPRKGKILNSEFQVVDNWGPTNYSLGQVTAVSIDSRGDVVIFHRADRIWDGSTFNSENVLLSKDKPIEKATILHLRRDSGKVMHEWGANFFYMPHGLTLDSEDNIWLTDVGLHQVYKFPSGYGDGKPLLTLGTKFQPGSGDSHFCKPTDVVILKNGEFFVSDGYCNSRIIHYSPSGVKIKEFGSHSWANGLSHAPKEGTFNVPHALALTGDDEEVCVADRENGRVQCFNTGTGNFVKLFKISEWGERLFSVAISPKLGNNLFCVNGPSYFSDRTLEVYEVNYSDEKLISSFSPHNTGLSNPHDLTVSEDGTEVYVVEIGPNGIWKFISDKVVKNTSASENGKENQNLEVKTGQLIEDKPNTLSLFSGGYSSLGVSSVVLGLLAVPIIVLSTLAIIMRCRKRGVHSRYIENSKFMNGLNGKHKNGGGLDLSSLLNKRRGFEQVATNDIDADDLDSADSDIEEFSLTATKV